MCFQETPEPRQKLSARQAAAETAEPEKRIKSLEEASLEKWNAYLNGAEELAADHIGYRVDYNANSQNYKAANEGVLEPGLGLIDRLRTATGPHIHDTAQYHGDYGKQDADAGQKIAYS